MEIDNIDHAKLPYVVTWNDEKSTGARGWIVIDSLHNGVASGGLFMHPYANLTEVSELARAMSYKNSLQQPRIGGAKGGICFNHLHHEAPQVLQRFLTAQQAIISDIWSTGADLNTDNQLIHNIIREKLKLPSGFVSVGKMLSRFYGIRNQADIFLERISEPASDYFTLGECATGYSVAMCVEALCASNSTVIIQGWGNVGRSLGYFLQNNQLARVTGIIEKDYFIYHDSALDINQLLSLRKNLLSQLLFPTEIYLQQVQALGYTVLQRDHSQSSADFLALCLEMSSADIFCPCALRYVIDDRVSNTLILHTFKYKKSGKIRIISGANNVFSDRGIIDMLEINGIMVLPEWVANSGNTLLFNETLKHPEMMNYLPEKQLSIIHQRVNRFLERAVLNGKTNDISLYSACYRLVEDNETLQV